MLNLKIFQQYPVLLKQLTELERLWQQIIDIAGLTAAALPLDHIALRMNHLDLARQWRDCLAADAVLLSDNEINGRPIYLFELKRPLQVLGQTVDVVELPFPTAKQYPQQGWEHIEMVVPFNPAETVDQWFMRIEKQLKTAGERIILQKSCHKAVGEGLPNPAVAIKLADKQHFAAVKLHPFAIKQIVMSAK